MDAKSITPPKVLNDVSQVPKRQKQLWDDENDPSTCVSLNVFMVLNVIIFTSQNYIFSPRTRGKDLNFYVGPQAPITNKNTSEEEKTFGKAS